MRRTDANGVSYDCVPSWAGKPEVAHGFFFRRGGVSPPPYDSLNAGPKGGDRMENVRENLGRVARALALPGERILCASQVHGDRVLHVSGSEPSLFEPGDPLQGDGLVTLERGLYLGILTADCVPILLFDPRRPAVGAVHAGWRGTAKGIAAKAVCTMRDELGCDASDLHAALGPAIGPCCYVVGDEVARAFVEQEGKSGHFLLAAGPGRWKLNLEGLNRHQLIRAGIRKENIDSSSLCTSCRNDLLFSARADGEPTGRQISIVGLRPAADG